MATKALINRDVAVQRLRAAYRGNDLTLYVGAGASIDSGLPTWKGLLSGVFINSLQSVPDSGELPVTQATAEAWFEGSGLPLDILARELRASFSPDDFMRWIRFSLYKWIDTNRNGNPTRRFIRSLRYNKTLSAIANLCRRTRVGKRGLKRVVSYNFDNLLELRLGAYPHEPLWMPPPARPTVLPIYHVHGFLPVRFPWTPYRKGTASAPDRIVLTEDQYHRQAADPYAWSNLVQLQTLSDTVGLTVGLSMSDPNMRRILDISRASNVRPEVYALLPPRQSSAPNDQNMDDILARTEGLLRRGHPWLGNGVDRKVAKSKRLVKRTATIWKQLDRLAISRHVRVMTELDVHPVWCEHAEIPGIIDRIVGR